MGIFEDRAQLKVDRTITRFRTSPIVYHPYVEGPVDRYGQRDKTFGTPSAEIIGRAIHNPTMEQVTIIGQGEVYEIAFLFSRLEMLRKFPSGVEGEWMAVEGQLEWRNRRYKIEKAKPSGQLGQTFSLFIIVANSILGHRDS